MLGLQTNKTTTQHVLTPTQKLVSCTLSPAITKTMQRPLLVRFGALGDMVILTVTIRALWRRFGMPVDIVSSGPWTLPLLGDQPGVGNIHLLASRRRPYLLSPDQWQLVRELRARGPGPTWMAETNSEKAMWLLKRAGWDDSEICHLADLPPKPEHYCDQLQRFANMTPKSLHNAPADEITLPRCELQVNEQKRADLMRWLHDRDLANRPCILIQAGNKRTMRRGARQRSSNTKYWPEENWAAVLHGLRELHPQHTLLLLGTPQEAELNQDILRLANINDAHDVANEMPIPRLMALAERAAGMISVDTGPAHVAAAVGCRVVTLFGAMNPAFYAPRGPGLPSRPVVGTLNGQQSIQGIQPDEVLRAWQERPLPRT